MASTSPTALAADLPEATRHLQDKRLSSAVEMNDLQSQPSSSAKVSGDTTDAAALSTGISSQTQPKMSIPQTTMEGPSSEIETRTSESKPRPPTGLKRLETEAIGPSSDNPVIKTDPAAGPAVMITLLLTTGARHPYRLDEKYLKKRNVNVESMNPFNVSVYTLKELIWRDWREEWEPRPTSPSYIRLIHFGRMLDDKTPLRECRFQQQTPNVIHMTIKPQEIADDEDARTGKGGTGRDRDGEERTTGCRCVIL
ncbi:hypothetical protein EJ05DRAFT_535115 [Pseudovirgaria hyperparasitica]|uniref:UBL3-like ubiquitin domain-containing protein n=1 Tax=Pseudovirgaria hyperparasitica TaxID=470096 RepID=A0A6A6WG49_9PEZI|nr:uncharacterized protein EJ05DRAFT_535115 [Pseudovirgaria hyperparasitica]KAF2761768.1 hypothetical protein EJ05DRAFT_535115 [Pseudovirgaria hyperparasitica]